MPDEREWYTAEQIGELFQVSTETVRRWVRMGILPVLRLGEGNRSGYRIRKEDVESFVQNNYGTDEIDSPIGFPEMMLNYYESYDERRLKGDSLHALTGTARAFGVSTVRAREIMDRERMRQRNTSPGPVPRTPKEATE